VTAALHAVKDARVAAACCRAYVPSSVRPSILGYLIAGGVITLSANWRVERAGDPEEVAAALCERKPKVVGRLYVFRHGDAVMAAATHRVLAPAVLASLHRDGEMVARALRHLGYPVVRGSTKNGGVSAFFRLCRLARSGSAIAVTPDGPLGPAGHVGAGTVELARRAGLSIVAVGFAASRALRVSSWDGCVIPSPFARVGVAYASPIHVSRSIDARTCERLRQEIELRLNTVRSVARRSVGAR
jgi:lysophospholipid acyltransferase (LPLAT)-like uncharacterized protein